MKGAIFLDFLWKYYWSQEQERIEIFQVFKIDLFDTSGA